GGGDPRSCANGERETRAADSRPSVYIITLHAPEDAGAVEDRGASRSSLYIVALHLIDLLDQLYRHNRGSDIENIRNDRDHGCRLHVRSRLRSHVHAKDDIADNVRYQVSSPPESDDTAYF